MGAALSDEGYSAQAQQQQRAQLLLLSQLREARAQEAGLGPGPGLRPAEQPGLRRTPVYQNPLHVRGRTLQLERRPPAKEGAHERWDVIFTFDSLSASEASVSLGVREGEDCWPPGGPTWRSAPVSFGPGLDQKFRLEVDYDCLMTPLWIAGACDSGEGDPAPFVTFSVELLAKEPSEERGRRAAEWTVGRFTQRLGGCAAPEVEVRTQHVRLPGLDMASSYEMREVYGAETKGPAVLGQDCVICMSETRDTAVLPCRHMCLCGSCAETMRSRIQYRSYRCPICRERVASFMQISKVPEALQTPQPTGEAPPPEVSATAVA